MKKMMYLCAKFDDMALQQTDSTRVWHTLWKKFHEACERWSLLENGDRVLIGLSGGKDSLLLTELLGRQAQIYVPKIEVAAVHVRVAQRNYATDIDYLQDFCEKAGVPLQVIDTQIPDENGEKYPSKDPCFLCSWFRRKALFDYAQREQYNKIAFGHHQDDVVHTLLMNLVYEGRATSMEPSLAMDKMPLTLIRPMYLIEEKDIIEYAQLQDYHKQLSLCAYEHETSRTAVQALIEMMQTLNPDVKSSLIHALNR